MPFATLSPGALLGRFQIRAVLGQGGMGVVYHAIDTGLRREVALKVLPAEVASNERFVARFQREAQAAAAIDHPNVVRVFFTGVEAGANVMAYELVTGDTLQARLRQGPLPWREAVRIGAGIARGLEAIHAGRLVHRDLKPANVLFDATGRPKISDFGLATDVTGSVGSLTRTGEVLGTPEYLSPEQADDSKRVDARADLYSLGALLFALLVGRPPFEGSGFALLKKHLQDAPPPPRRFVKDVPPQLDALVLQLLAKDPAARPQTAAAVAAVLEALDAGEKTVEASGTSNRVVAGGVVLGVSVGAVAIAVLLSRSAPPAAPPAPEPPASAAPSSPEAAPLPGTRGLTDRELQRGFTAGKRFRLAATWGGYAWKQGGEALFVAIAPDGRLALTGTSQQPLEHGGVPFVLHLTKLWDVDSGREVWTRDEEGQVRAAEISPRGDQAIVWSAQRHPLIIDLATGRVVRTLDHLGDALSVAWAPDGRTVVTAGGPYKVATDRDCMIKQWDVATGRLVREIPVPGGANINSVAFLGPQRVFSALSSGVAIVWDLETGNEIAREASPRGTGRPTYLSATRDGRAVTNDVDHGGLTIWDTNASRPRVLGEHFKNESFQVSVTPDGSRLVAMAHEGWKLWSSLGDEFVDTVATDPGRGIAITADGRRAVTAHTNGLVRCWDVATKTEVGRREGVDGAVQALARYRGDLQALSRTENELRWWSQKGPRVREPVVPYPEASALSSDGTLFAVARSLWNEKTPHGRQLWSTSEGGPHWSVSDLAAVPISMCFARDKSCLLIGDEAGFVRRFEVSTGYAEGFPLPGPQPVTAVAAAETGAPWLAGGRSGAVWFEPEPGQEPRAAESRHKAAIYAAAMRDGRAVTGDAEGHVEVWDVNPRTSLDLPLAHSKAVTAVALAPGGKRAVTASVDRTIAVWDLESRALVTRIDLASSADFATALVFEERAQVHAGTVRGVVLTFQLEP
jgi:serine/threonine-protein kinase